MEASPSNHIEIQAWAILPNHYHLLIYTEDLKYVGSVVRSIHGTTAYQWNREDKMKGRKIWYCYGDRAIRSQRHYYTTLNYIHYNPVKHGCVQSPYDWSASSVEWYRQSRGRNWLRELWVNYPVRDYGKGWDDL
jgi:putative transposase